MSHPSPLTDEYTNWFNNMLKNLIHMIVHNNVGIRINCLNTYKEMWYVLDLRAKIHKFAGLQHVYHLKAVLRTLRWAALMASPKCATDQMCSTLDHGQMCPQIDKSAMTSAYPRPKTKNEVRLFLEQDGYYHRFMANDSDVTSLLIDII